MNKFEQVKTEARKQRALNEKKRQFLIEQRHKKLSESAKEADWEMFKANDKRRKENKNTVQINEGAIVPGQHPDTID